MEKAKTMSDERKIYFATKAVHVYKHFKKDHARATYLVNKNMGVDDTFPPMVRVGSVKMWKNWKRLVVLLEKWIEKDGLEKFEKPELLNVCIVVLKMMIDNEAKRLNDSIPVVDRVNN